MTAKTGKELEMALAVRQCAEALTIQNQEQYDLAAGFLTDVKQKMKEVELAMDPSCKAAYAAWQTALDQKKKYLAPYIEAEVVVKRTLSNYLIKQDIIAKVAEAKAISEAKAAEEKERAKLLKRANKLDGKGLIEDAEELRDQAENVFVPVVAPDYSVTKAAGVTSTEDFDIDITDMALFLGWVINNMDCAAIVTIKTQPIKQYIKLTKITNIPGTRLTKKMVISAKGHM